MAALKIAVLCGLLCLAAAEGPAHLAYAPAYKATDYYAPPEYKFDYGVKDPHTGDYKSQWEAREGDVVKGSYSVVDPDGTIRTVDYTADEHNGFNAVVKKTAAAHPHLVKPVVPVVAPAHGVLVSKPVVVAKPVVTVAKPVFIPARKPVLKAVRRPAPLVFTAPAPSLKGVALPSYDPANAYADAGVAYPAPQPASYASLPAPQPATYASLPAPLLPQPQQVGYPADLQAFAPQPAYPAPAPYAPLPAPQAYAAPAGPAPEQPIDYEQLYQGRLINAAAAAFGNPLLGATQQANNPGPVLFPVNPEDRTPPPPRNVPPHFQLYQQGSAAVRAGSTVAAVNAAYNNIYGNQQQPQPVQNIPGVPSLQPVQNFQAAPGLQEIHGLQGVQTLQDVAY